MKGAKDDSKISGMNSLKTSVVQIKTGSTWREGSLGGKN